MSEFENLLDVLTAGRELPDGFDAWGIKSTNPDLTTRGGFRWPFPGNVAEAPDFDFGNTDACPAFPGDGLCVARSWAGMASGGFPAVTLLLVAYRSDRARGSADKVRTDRVAVVGLVDGARLVREHGSGADLCWANLSGADLRGANLFRADLCRANLSRANLPGANLHGACLSGANLSGANLRGANLSGVNLSGADLFGANLSASQRALARDAGAIL